MIMARGSQHQEYDLEDALVLCEEVARARFIHIYIHTYIYIHTAKDHFLPALLQKLVGERSFAGEKLRELWQEFCGIFGTHKTKRSNIWGNISEHNL